MVKKRRNLNLPKPECNRTGTGYNFNLIMRMTVTVLCHRRTRRQKSLCAGNPTLTDKTHRPESVFN